MKLERRWAFWFGAILMLATTLPYLVGYFSQTSDWRYSGLVIAEEDGYSYLAKMLSGANGAWLFKTPYTLTPQSGFLGFLPYLLLGKLGSPPGQHEQLVSLFHLLRIAGGIFACLAIYEFISLFVMKVKWRRLATVIAMLGGGLGGLSLLGLSGVWRGPMPLEFYSPETFGFLGLLAIPHLAWARAFLFWGLVIYLKSSSWRSATVTGVLWLIMGLFQPLVVVVGWAILGVHLIGIFAWGWRTRQIHLAQPKMWISKAVTAGVISSPIVIYNFLSFQIDPFLNRWQAQNYLPSPPVTDYLLAYGVLLPLIVLGLIGFWKKIDPKNVLLIAWICAFPVLAYLPYNLQRRLPEGLWVALAILAVIGLERISERWRRYVYIWLGIGFLPALILFGVAFQSATILSRPSFRPSGEVQAFTFFASQPIKKPAVLAAYDTSTALPAYADVRVPIGHGPESLGLSELRPKLETLFESTMTDADRETILRDMKIDYIFYGPLERKLGDFDPDGADYLIPVYSSAGYSIYQVENNID